jgi:hypothetical protein
MMKLYIKNNFKIYLKKQIEIKRMETKTER